MIRNLLGFVIGAGFWMFLYWLSGSDIPTQRGADAVFYLLILLAFGGLGWLASSEIRYQKERNL